MSLTPEQIAFRRTGITATDMRALAGVCPWRSPLDVYADKVCDEPGFAGNDRTELGHALEPVALHLLAQEKGLEFAPGDTEAHPILPWVLATPDGIEMRHAQRVGLGEAKVVGKRMLADWGEEDDAIPDYVRVQTQWQMTALRLPRTHVVALLETGTEQALEVELGGKHFFLYGMEPRFYIIEHDEGLSAALLDLGDTFMRKHLVPRVPPPASGVADHEALRRIFPKHVHGMLQAPLEAEDWAKRYFDAHTMLKEAESAKAEAQSKLCALIGDHEGFVGDGWKCTWRKAQSGGVAWKDLAETFAPSAELIDKFTQPGTRRFLCKAIKEKTK